MRVDDSGQGMQRQRKRAFGAPFSLTAQQEKNIIQILHGKFSITINDLSYREMCEVYL